MQSLPGSCRHFLEHADTSCPAAHSSTTSRNRGNALPHWTHRKYWRLMHWKAYMLHIHLTCKSWVNLWIPSLILKSVRIDIIEPEVWLVVWHGGALWEASRLTHWEGKSSWNVCEGDHVTDHVTVEFHTGLCLSVLKHNLNTQQLAKKESFYILILW